MHLHQPLIHPGCILNASRSIWAWADSIKMTVDLIDPGNEPDYCSKESWAGRFVKLHPTERTNYHTGVEPESWYHSDPGPNWDQALDLYEVRLGTLPKKCNEIVARRLEKMKRLYS